MARLDSSETVDISRTDDCVQPFLIDASGLNGRLVRLGPVVDEILDRHDYAVPVRTLLSEVLALTAGLATALKFDGVFTLQTKGDGPIPMMVADVTSDGALRGFAQVTGDIPPAEEVAAAPIPSLLGKGHIAFTVDQGPETERYQGLVELNGATLEDCVHHYFRQSAQFSSVVRLAAGQTPAGDWRAACLMLQRLAEEDRAEVRASAAEDEDWRRATMLLGTADDGELLDENLPPADLLFRLFHEDGVRVFDSKPLRDECRCSRERIGRVLATLDREELKDMRLEDGRVTVTCEFCNRMEGFTDTDLDGYFSAAEGQD